MVPLVVCLALAPAPSGPPQVRLADLLDEARRKNPRIHAAEAEARADAAVADSAGALDDPTAMVQLWNMPVDLSTVPLMVNVTQTIPLGGKRAARESSA